MCLQCSKYTLILKRERKRESKKKYAKGNFKEQAYHLFTSCAITGFPIFFPLRQQNANRRDNRKSEKYAFVRSAFPDSLGGILNFTF